MIAQKEKIIILYYIIYAYIYIYIQLGVAAVTYCFFSHHTKHSWKWNSSPTSHSDTIQDSHLYRCQLNDHQFAIWTVIVIWVKGLFSPWDRRNHKYATTHHMIKTNDNEISFLINDNEISFYHINIKCKIPESMLQTS